MDNDRNVLVCPFGFSCKFNVQTLVIHIVFLLVAHEINDRGNRESSPFYQNGIIK